MPAKGRELSVIGGGVIGLACAVAAADAGWSVTVYDAGRARRASHVAGGMLGCLGEGHPGEDALLAVSAESVAGWPALLARLGDPDVLTADDSLLVAASATDLAYLEQQTAYLAARLPGAAERLERRSAAGLRADEPALARGVVGGYLARGEGAVDNRRLLAALAAVLGAAGGTSVEARIGDPADVPGDRVLVAAGLDSPAVVAASGTELPLTGEKGEILRLARTAWSVKPPSRVIRGRWHGRSVYLVPRADGLVLGATQYEAAGPDDRAPQTGGAADLLADATALMPGLRTYEVTEVAAGIRPSSPDGLPIVRDVDRRVIVATGHGRNGIALAPWTAKRVLELLG